MSELRRFVLARLDEDEQHAEYWLADRRSWSAVGRDVEVGGGRLTDGDGVDRHVAEHVARHDPARVLLEVAAKRALVEYYDSAVLAVAIGRSVLASDYLLRLLASVYAGHPDYRAEWAPDGGPA